jgi:hypothetical protein
VHSVRRAEATFATHSDLRTKTPRSPA